MPPTSIVTPDQDTIVTEIDIAAPAERVFAAICDQDVVRRRAPHLDLFEMELRVGGKWDSKSVCQSHIEA